MITPSFGLTATERVLPRLALDFTTASLDARVIFSRSLNTATVTNSSGYVVPINADLPRFDYDPVTLACKGLLIEENRTNLLLQSEDFETTWADTGTTTQTKNVVIAPSNTQTGNEITSGTVGYNGAVQSVVITSSANSYTGSCYLKAGTVTSVRLRLRFYNLGTTADGNAYFNLSAGTATADGNRTATITPVGNSWYRCTITGADNNTGNNRADLFVMSNNQQGNFYAWGAQLEAGALPTSYIPTTTTSLTRNADVATMTGTNFSNWFNPVEGAFAVYGSYLNQAGTQTWFSVSNNTAAERLRIVAVSATVTRFSSTTGNVETAAISKTTASGANKFCGAYKLNDYAFTSNGTAVGTDTAVVVPTVSQINIGSEYTGTNVLNGHIQKLLYYPQRLTNAEVQAFSK